VTTTIHLPPDLLEQVDRRASQLGVSRNRYIRTALETAVRTETAWSGALVQRLQQAAADKDLQKTVGDMMQAIASRRSRKKPPSL
jgi:predicted transcriptional regulator